MAVGGMHWSQDDVYHHGRFTQAHRIAAELFASVDVRDADSIEATVFRELTHLAPIPVVDGAVFDADGRILLIQRADNRLWAMPGGAIEMGETPAEAAAREVREEAGVVVEPIALAGIWDSRICGAITPLQLYMMVFLCRVTGAEPASHAVEVLDQGWFEREQLPPLSPGHVGRLPDVFRFYDTRIPYFDR